MRARFKASSSYRQIESHSLQTNVMSKATLFFRTRIHINFAVSSLHMIKVFSHYPSVAQEAAARWLSAIKGFPGSSDFYDINGVPDSGTHVEGR